MPDRMGGRSTFQGVVEKKGTAVTTGLYPFFDTDHRVLVQFSTVTAVNTTWVRTLKKERHRNTSLFGP